MGTFPAVMIRIGRGQSERECARERPRQKGGDVNHAELRPGVRAFICFWLACIFMAIAPSTARAQAPPYSYQPQPETRFTISPFIGARFGGRIDVNAPDVDRVNIGSSLNWGFNAGVAILPNLFGEFMWNRQTTTLGAHHLSTNDTVTLTNRAHLDLYHVSLLYEFWSHSPIRPFVVAGIGVTHFDSFGILNFENRFSYNVGGGVKYMLAPQVALRAELRYSPSRTTSSNTVFCDPSFGCFTTPISNHAQQGQANIGVEFRF